MAAQIQELQNQIEQYQHEIQVLNQDIQILQGQINNNPGVRSIFYLFINYYSIQLLPRCAPNKKSWFLDENFQNMLKHHFIYADKNQDFFFVVLSIGLFISKILDIHHNVLAHYFHSKIRFQLTSSSLQVNSLQVNSLQVMTPQLLE